MLRRYGHGHSLGLGFVLALALERHALTFAVLIFAAGLAAGRAWWFWGMAASALRDKWHLSRRNPKLHPRPTPVYKASAQTDDIPF